MKANLRVEDVSPSELCPDPLNPRTYVDEQADAELTESIRKYGVKVPLLAFQSKPKNTLLDGCRRWLCSQVAEMQTVPVIIFPNRPTDDDLLLTQLTINAHRQNLNPMDEHEAYLRLAKLRDWTPTQLADGIAVSNVEVSRVMLLGKLAPDEQDLVRKGLIPKTSGCALARIPAEDRVGLAQRVAAGEVTRDQLDSLARQKSKTDKVTRQKVCCTLPEGTVTVNCSKSLTLSSLIELLDALARKCRKLRTQKLDITTAMRVLRDQVSGEAADSTIQIKPN